MQIFITVGFENACQTPKPMHCINIRVLFHGQNWRLPSLLEKGTIKKEYLVSYDHDGRPQFFLQNSHGMLEEFVFVTSYPNLGRAMFNKLISMLGWLLATSGSISMMFSLAALITLDNKGEKYL